MNLVEKGLKSSWGSDKNDSRGAPKPSGGDQTGKKDGDNTWSQSKPSSGGGSSILGQWGKSNEDGWNSSKGTGGSGMTVNPSLQTVVFKHTMLSPHFLLFVFFCYFYQVI